MPAMAELATRLTATLAPYDGGFDEVTEFCSRKASFRSRSAICFSASELRRSFSRSSGRCSVCNGFAPSDERCLLLAALKHIHCQVFQQRSRSNVKDSSRFFRSLFFPHLNCYEK
jgi:hypothetical protein